MADTETVLQRAREGRGTHLWEGSFRQYLDMVLADPGLARSAHSRLADMLDWSGKRPGPDGVPQHGLFADEVFGLDRELDRIVEFYRGAASGAGASWRALLLVGPPGSGKSTIMGLLRDGLERYSRTPQGAVYAIKGCPVREDPLHLLSYDGPTGGRTVLAEGYVPRVEGDLCPRCRSTLRDVYGGDIGRVPVERVLFSRWVGAGSGSFSPASCGSGDPATLVGSVGASGDELPALDGEMEAASRGIMEVVEPFKAGRRSLALVMNAVQAGAFRLGTHGSVHPDQVVVARSNETDYLSYLAGEGGSPLLERMVMVRVPYLLRVSDEARIYERMLSGRHGTIGRVPGIAPLTHQVAAVLAVLSRLERPGRGRFGRVSLLAKRRLYDGQPAPPYTPEDAVELRHEAPREGYFGLSPAFVGGCLAGALARERVCLTPARALSSLAQGIGEVASLDRTEVDRISALVPDAAAEYQEAAIRDVQRAATDNFPSRARCLFQSYLRAAEAASGDSSGPQAPPEMEARDRDTLKRLEGALGLRDMDRPRFRRDAVDTYRQILRAARRLPLDYTAIPALAAAIDEALLPGRNQVRFLIHPGAKEPDRTRARERICRNLISDYGYCEECAGEAVHVAWMALQGKRLVSARGGRLQWTSP